MDMPVLISVIIVVALLKMVVPPLFHVHVVFVLSPLEWGLGRKTTVDLDGEVTEWLVFGPVHVTGEPNIGDDDDWVL